MKNKILFIITMLIYFITPLVIYFNDELFKYKFYFLTFIGVILLIIFLLNKVKLKEIGITKNNCLSSIKRNSLLIIIFSIIIILCSLFGHRFTPNESLMFYLFYIFVSVPIQEFLYRGIFGYFEETLIKNKLITIILSSLCYSFVHIIYHDILTLVLTFSIGIIWYYLYRKDKNLMGVSISHIILGILTIVLGIID